MRVGVSAKVREKYIDGLVHMEYIAFCEPYLKVTEGAFQYRGVQHDMDRVQQVRRVLAVVVGHCLVRAVYRQQKRAQCSLE